MSHANTLTSYICQPYPVPSPLVKTQHTSLVASTDSPDIPRINPRVLARALAKKPHFRATLLRLLEDNGFDIPLVRRCVQTFRQVFALDGEAIVLKPKLALCPMNDHRGRCRYGTKCRSLHVCAEYLKDECDKVRCPQGHGWDEKPNSVLVHKLFLDHLNVSELNKLVVSLQDDYARKGTKSGLHRPPATSSEGGDDSSQSDEEDEGFEDPSGDESVSPTVWSHYMEGEVTIPEICYDSVVGKCASEEVGCPRLHAALPFHWQTKKPGGFWYNLQPAQAEHLELNYCDPSKETCMVPKLDPTVYCESECDLLALMGLAQWEANFETMTLFLPPDDELQIRRLCVEHIDEVAQAANVNMWYYEVQEWLPYGLDQDSAPNNGVTCAEIERAFLNDKYSRFYFTTERHTYTLDFETMTQINDTTGYTRRVRRRPKPHLKKEELLG